VADVFSEAADIVIVGSGPTGSTYARLLSELLPDARILMVEAGPIVADPPGLHVANIRDLGLRDAARIASQGPNRFAYDPVTPEEHALRLAGGPDTAMLRRPGLFLVGGGAIDGEGFAAAHAAANVGGMGSHWFGACPRPAESERIPFIDRAIMDGALAKAERLLRVSGDQFPNSPVAPRLEAVLGDLFNAGRSPERRVQPMPMALTRTADGVMRTGTDMILGDLLSKPSGRFELRPETVCRRIVMDGERAAGVELWSVATGAMSRVAAGVVVAAADSLHSPQLLFASGIRPDALGHYLNEHPQLSLYAELDGVEDHGERLQRGEVGVLADTAVAARTTSGVTWIPYDGDRFPFHVQITQIEPSSLPEGDRVIASRKPVVAVSFFLPSEPRYENHVAFSDSETDWCGRPKMNLRFRLSERDRERLALARETLQRICDALGRPLPGHKPRMPPDGSSLHYQGTIRMGERDDGGSVADRDSRVWGTANLYVAGNGVIPTETAGNPTLTSVALASLGARHIAAGWASR
jgi:choline dehydrogenase-like flavoprotein